MVTRLIVVLRVLDDHYESCMPSLYKPLAVLAGKTGLIVGN